MNYEYHCPILGETHGRVSQRETAYMPVPAANLPKTKTLL